MTAEILAIVKTLRGITDNEQDGLLEIYINMTVQSILNRCRLPILPQELKFVAASMANDMYEETHGDAPVSSISEQGASVSFDRSIIEAKIKDRVSNARQLDEFTQMYRF